MNPNTTLETLIPDFHACATFLLLIAKYLGIACPL